MTHFCRELLPYAGENLWRALRQACDGERFPMLGSIKNLCRQTNISTYVEPPKLTEGQQARADQKAVMSMLWIHHHHGWKPEDFAMSVFERQLGDLLERTGRTVTDVFEEYAKTYTKEQVEKWMDDQERSGS